MVRVAAAPGVRAALPVVSPTGLPASRVMPAMALWITTGVLARSVAVAGWALVAASPPTVAVTALAAMVLR